MSTSTARVTVHGRARAQATERAWRSASGPIRQPASEGSGPPRHSLLCVALLALFGLGMAGQGSPEPLALLSLLVCGLSATVWASPR